MKKIGLLLVGVLALFSCEQEELDSFVKSDVPEVQTRAASSIADFDLIAELDGIPVNILNVGNTSRKYLSCVKEGNKVDLFTRDDGSGRQRWKITKQNMSSELAILLEKGNSGMTSNKLVALAPDPYAFTLLGRKDKPTNVKLIFLDKSSMLPGFGFIPLADGKCFIGAVYGEFPYFPTHLRSQSSTSSNLSFNDDNSTDLSKWKLVPVGEYELVDLEYVRVTVDNFEPSELICDHDEYTNHTSSVDTWNYSVTTTYTETSNFSKTEGVSVSVSQGMSVGLPNILGKGSIINFNTTIQQQSSQSWTYGTSKTQTVTKTRTGQISVQPGETVRLEALLTMYKGSLTYVATLRKIGDTKTFKVRGKWSGDCFSSFKARTYNPTTGKLMGEYSLK